MPDSAAPADTPPTLPGELQGLLRPEAYPHPVDPVRVVQTHMSWILLTGPFVYKIKRPVRFAFADFTDPAHRAHLCNEEIRLNRRFAPDLYVGVSPIRRSAGQASFVGDGPTIEMAVRMRQFDREAELGALVAADAVTGEEFEAFGANLAAIHARLAPLPVDAPYGREQAVIGLIRRNYAECLAQQTGQNQAAALRALRSPLGRLAHRCRPVIAARAAAGRVRECHGDLHLSNIVRLDGALTAFDALEFEPAFRCIDVADEVAFLCADLQGHARPDLAAAFLGGYLDASGDFDLLRVLDLYVAHRGLVRAKIMGIRAATAPAAGQRVRSLDRQADYVDVARRALEPRAPRLVLMHGLSGSGKTWLARPLARALGAVHLRSDLERKRLAGLEPLARSASAPGAGLYGNDASERTYARLAQATSAALAAGRTVICDATFLSRTRRTTFRELADRAGAPTLLLHCTAPQAELRRRLRARQADGRDASEADEAVLGWQRDREDALAADERIGAIRVDTAGADPLGAALTQLAAARAAAAS